MNKEHWIEKVIEQSQHISEVEPNPMLHSRILQNLNKQTKHPITSTTTIIKWSVAATIVILLNISVIVMKSKNFGSNHHTNYSVKTISNSFDNSTTYNY